MINVRIAEQLDSEQWDTYVFSHPDASPYHLFAWGKAVQQAYGHQPRYFIAEENQNVVGILPAIQLRFPFLLNELVALPFCDVGNCLYDNNAALDAILSKIISLGKRSKVHTIQLRGRIESLQIQSADFVPEMKNKVRMFLDLPDSSETLMQNFKAKLRSQIKKAEKNDLVFQWGSEQDLDDFYTVFSENMHALGSPVHSRAFFQAILQHYRENSRIGLIYSQKTPIGAGLILMQGSSVSIPWASTLRRYNRLAPNMLLYWNFLKYSADNGYTIFDLGRSSTGEGTYRFKAQWGARPRPLDWYSLQLRGKRTEKNTDTGIPNRSFYADIWQKMPLSLANYLGPRVRKYISL